MQQMIKKLFDDKQLVEKIQIKLPQLFHIAELECAKSGSAPMEVGSIREKIIIALLIHKFGEKNVDTVLSAKEAEIDVKLFDNPISIKTITSNYHRGIKLSWTVDAQKSSEFSEHYEPSCDMIYVHINWNNAGGLYYISREIQQQTLFEIGRENYLKLPKSGTNPRGVELSGATIRNLISHTNTLKIPIFWKKENVDYNPYQRWLELWKND